MQHIEAQSLHCSPSLLVARAIFAALILVVVCAPAPSLAQGGGGVDYTGTGGNHSIQGRIVFPSGRRADVRLKVRLESSGSGDLSVLADANGSFSFRSLRPGYYTVVIDGGDDFETVRESVFIESAGISSRRGPTSPPVSRPYTLQIYLRPKSPETPLAKPGVLNAALAEVPKPALELYEQAIEAARNGDNEKAVEHLRAAVALHPEFPLALSEMGVLYMKMREPERAAEVLRKTLELTPGDYAALLTYGRALFDLQEFSESERVFRDALNKNASSPSAHFYIGLLLLKRRALDEAEVSFQNAIKSGGESMALAHYYLGGIYWGRREYGRAADALETYLRLEPDSENAKRVRATIKELRKKL